MHRLCVCLECEVRREPDSSEVEVVKTMLWNIDMCTRIKHSQVWQATVTSQMWRNSFQPKPSRLQKWLGNNLLQLNFTPVLSSRRRRSHEEPVHFTGISHSRYQAETGGRALPDQSSTDRPVRRGWRPCVCTHPWRCHSVRAYYGFLDCWRHPV